MLFGPKTNTYYNPVLTKPHIARGEGTATICLTIWDNEAALDLQQWETPDVKLFFQFVVSF